MNEDTFESICDEAKFITGSYKMSKYGHPSHNFEQISRLWTSYLRKNHESIHITKHDVALMMILLKICREQAGHQRDNLVDIAGYSRNIEQMIAADE